MPSVLNEHTQFVDDDGKPLVDGKVYFGAQGADPKISPITIYSDRGFGTVIANPQPLDEYGRTANKVWVPGRYSILVEDYLGNQKYQQLDNGSTPDLGVTSLENVSGSNTIIAESSSTIVAYEDGEQYTFRTVAPCSDAVTLNIDGVGAKPIKKDFDQPLQDGDFQALQNVIVSWNKAADYFEWTNQNLRSKANYVGTQIADQATPAVPTDGNYFEALGTTTRTGYSVEANRSWVEKTLGDRLYTASSSIVTPNSEDVSVQTGDVLFFQSTTENVAQLLSVLKRATPTPINLGTAVQTTSGTAIDLTAIPSGVKRITVMLDGVSTSGTSTPILQIGDGGTVETTGYSAYAGDSAGVASYTGGFGLIRGGYSAASLVSGMITFCLLDESTNTWVAHGGFSFATAAVNVSGIISLSDDLDIIRLTTAGGSDNFDAGKMNISWEF